MKRKVIISLFLSAFVLASSLAQAQGAKNSSNHGQRGYSQPGNNNHDGRQTSFHKHPNKRRVYASNNAKFQIHINYSNSCRARTVHSKLIYERGVFFKRTRYGKFIQVNPPIGYRVNHIPIKRSHIHFHGRRKHFIFKGIVYRRSGNQFEVVGIKPC